MHRPSTRPSAVGVRAVPSPAAATGAVLGGRSLRRWGIVAALLSWFALATAVPALAAPLAAGNLDGVTIADTAENGQGVLNHTQLEADLKDISFHQPTKVAFYTRSDTVPGNLNTQTLLYARASHPEWISTSNPDKWADGLLIVSLSVQPDGHGQVGTYFGEDRSVSQDTQKKLQAAGTDAFVEARWTDGVLDVTRAAAKVMNRPWYQSPALWIPVGVGGGAAAVIGGGVAISRSNNRSKTAAALKTGGESMTRVTMDLDNTELSAKALPATGSKHAADLAARFDAFMLEFRRLTQEQQELEATSKKQRGSGAVRQRAERYSTGAQDLDAVDDSISAAAALFTRTATWREAWALQIAPLQEDLHGIPAVLNTAAASPAAGVRTAGAALDAWLPNAQARLQQLSAGLEGQTLSVDDALTGLATLRTELSEQLHALAQVQMDSYARSESERAEMRRQMEQAQSYRRRPGSILDTTMPSIFWTAYAYNAGYHSGVQRVDSSRQAASSSSGGHTTGYSGGGGSFSGSGSSSSF